MSYTTSGISILACRSHDLGRTIRASVSHTDKFVQCYVSGRLVAWQEPSGGVVEFVLADPVDEDLVFLLAVDEDEAQTNYWAEAFPTAAAYGNRISVRIPVDGTIYRIGDILKIDSGEDGQSQGDVLVFEREMFVGGRHALGWGQGQWGDDGWGFSGSDCIGYGYNFGSGPWGFDCEAIEWLSEPKAPGKYPVKVIVLDAVGNESTAYETTISVDTFARPPSNLKADSYDSATDTLMLSFERSDDDRS